MTLNQRPILNEPNWTFINRATQIFWFPDPQPSLFHTTNPISLSPWYMFLHNCNPSDVYNECPQINFRKMSDSQCMSSLTEVEAGMDMLLLEAWHVRMEWRSSRRSWTSLSSLTTFDSNSFTSSETSSRSAWSRHQLTRGWGRPEKTKIIFCIMQSSPLNQVPPSLLQFTWGWDQVVVSLQLKLCSLFISKRLEGNCNEWMKVLLS